MPRARMDPAIKARLLKRRSRGPHGDEHLSGRELVVERVSQWIFEGRLHGGDVLSQEDLAEILAMSRIPVRDGLIALESAGWVAIEPGVGAKAIGLDAASIEDSFEVFSTIWALLIRRSVLSCTDTDLLLAVSDRVQAAKTPSKMATESFEFVRVLSEMAGAPRLEAAFRNAGRIVPGDIFSVIPGAVEVQQSHLPGIGHATASHDVKRALALAASLCETHAENVIRFLADRGVIMPSSVIRSSGVQSQEVGSAQPSFGGSHTTDQAARLRR
jgi:DNA-binding GntR family transcriptional regulator